MDRQTTIERLEEMEQWLLDKSYSDLRARDHYEIVGAAIELLRTQEPVKPEKRELPFGLYDAVRYEYTCGACGCGLMNNERCRTKFCPECGKKVKWNDRQGESD